jgi:hypothetical protein
MVIIVDESGALSKICHWQRSEAVCNFSRIFQQVITDRLKHSIK